MTRFRAVLGVGVVGLFLGTFVGCEGEENPFSDFLEYPDWGGCGTAWHRDAKERLAQVAAYLQAHPERLDYQLVRRRRVPGYANRKTTVVYGVIKAAPHTVAALVTDYEIFGPYIYMNNSARLILRGDQYFSAPSRQAVIRYESLLLVPYVLRQGVEVYSTSQGPAFHLDWDNLAVQPGKEPDVDIHGFARFSPFAGPNGESWTVYRYDSFVNLLGRPNPVLAEEQFEIHPADSSHWAERGSTWRYNPLNSIATVVRSFKRYVEALVFVDNSSQANQIRNQVAVKVGSVIDWGGGDLLQAYRTAREGALLAAFLDPDGTSMEKSLIWDYAPLAVAE